MLLPNLLFLTLAGLDPAVQTHPGISWRSDYTAARKEVEKSGRPILVYFTTTWCGYCRIMEKETFPDPAVGKQAALYVPVKLDAEKEGKELAQKFGVSSYPNFLVLDSKQKLVARFEGFHTAKEFVVRIDQILNHGTLRARIDQALRLNPNDGRANAQSAILLLGDGRDKEALAAIERSRAAGFRGKELARALTDYGKQFARSDYKSASLYLEEAITMDQSESLTDAFDSLMLASVYAAKPDAALDVAKRVLRSSKVEAPLKERANRFVKSAEYTPKLSTPEGLVYQLLLQLQGQDKRDKFYFTTLFQPGAFVTAVFKNERLGLMKLDVTVDSWIETNGIDKLKSHVNLLKKQVDLRGNVALAWLDYEVESTLPSGETQTHTSSLALQLMQNGDRWYIASMIQQ